jgi:hypothetical protein
MRDLGTLELFPRAFREGKQFGDLTPWQESELHHCCELQHLAAEARSALLTGVTGVSIADLSRFAGGRC